MPKEISDNKMLTIKDITEIYSVSRNTALKWCREEGSKAKKTSNGSRAHWRYEKKLLDARLSENAGPYKSA